MVAGSIFYRIGSLLPTAIDTDQPTSADWLSRGPLAASFGYLMSEVRNNLERKPVSEPGWLTCAH